MIKECLTKELCSSFSAGARCIGVVRFEFPDSAIIIRSDEVGGLYCAILVRDSYLKLVELRPAGGARDVSEARVAARQVSRSVFLMIRKELYCSIFLRRIARRLSYSTNSKIHISYTYYPIMENEITHVYRSNHISAMTAHTSLVLTSDVCAVKNQSHWRDSGSCQSVRFSSSIHTCTYD